ncbi:MAG TPA: class IV adenylate cyclase [bacterium]|nr:class IV adenylate cyclase [bacterium]HPN35535.1 class IV adenylate cyclase [bacterium]
MARNTEIKARIDSVEQLLPVVAALADRGPVEIDQEDVFFTCPCGRLKLRTLSADEGELIFYQRADQPGPKESFYQIARTSTPAALHRILAQVLTETGRIRKRRILFLHGAARIHLDRVEGLGDFIELEVVLRKEQSAEQGAAIAEELMELLGIEAGRLIECSYFDLQQHPRV